ncbi:MAG: alkylglycerol monooxygenase [Pseudohongiellaceae bacterium]|jgi:alkylglycerol monooxygenase|nr:sterol desaturase family protein [Pseudomonadota bacterium]MDA1292054.1 sterol desaturase family protein [Pseudomonadota bacterium]
MDLILIAIPFFFLLIFIEWVYGLLRGNNTYRLNDSINSISMGSLSRLQSLVILGFSGSIYEIVVARYQLAQLADDALWVWISCFILYDFAYYWKHRFGHEVALFWGSHVAHHQSEDYNLSTALRQTSVDFYGFAFYLPFFFLGFPAEILFTVVSLNLIYQFWVHTEHVPKLGPIEWLFVTPSNHRVHHARNKIYVDRNYGGVFILWDRIFGSFQEEIAEEPAVFGLRKPLNSWNPIWANVHVYWRLTLDFVSMPGIANKLKLLFKPPGWRAESQQSHCKLGIEPVDLTARFDPAISPFSLVYTCVQFLFTVVLSLAVLLGAASLSYSLVSLAVIYLFFSFCVAGAWLEGKEFALTLEIVRLVFLVPCLLLLGLNSIVTALLVVNAAIALPLLLIIGSKRIQVLAINQ